MTQEGKPLLHPAECIPQTGSMTDFSDSQIEFITDLNQVTETVQSRQNLAPKTIITALRLYTRQELAPAHTTGPSGQPITAFHEPHGITNYTGPQRPVITHADETVSKWLNRGLAPQEIYAAMTTYLQTIERDRGM